MKTNKTPLEQAVADTPDVSGHFEKGLHAIKSEYKHKVYASDPRKITGSIDIDSATQSIYPKENRWDYAIEYDSSTYFVEFHPASTGNVSEMMKKLVWLKTWLNNKAQKINELKPTDGTAFNWISTGSIRILSNSKQYKQLAQSGLLPKSKLLFSTSSATKATRS